MIKPKFDPNDCRECVWNHANYSDEGFAKPGHCQKLEDVPPVKCALRKCRDSVVVKEQAAEELQPGTWVLVRTNRRSKKLSVAQVISNVPPHEVVLVMAYESNPGRFVFLAVERERVKGPAPESETLRDAKELQEIDTLRERRKALGVTQRDFAEIVGVGMGAVRDAEHGRRHTQKQVRHWLLEGLRKLENQKRTQAA